jgi:hypothetical protein
VASRPPKTTDAIQCPSSHYFSFARDRSNQQKLPLMGHRMLFWVKPPDPTGEQAAGGRTLEIL